MVSTLKPWLGGIKIHLPDRELNPGLPRDRRGYSPLYYRGCVFHSNAFFMFIKVSNEIGWKRKISPNVGLEPTTPRLRVSCSTDWASRALHWMPPVIYQVHQLKWNTQAEKNTSPNVGLEPTTPRLRVSCSTDWASRALCNFFDIFFCHFKASTEIYGKFICWNNLLCKTDPIWSSG